MCAMRQEMFKLEMKFAIIIMYILLPNLMHFLKRALIVSPDKIMQKNK